MMAQHVCAPGGMALHTSAQAPAASWPGSGSVCVLLFACVWPGALPCDDGVLCVRPPCGALLRTAAARGCEAVGMFSPSCCTFQLTARTAAATVLLCVLCCTCARRLVCPVHQACCAAVRGFRMVCIRLAGMFADNYWQHFNAKCRAPAANVCGVPRLGTAWLCVVCSGLRCTRCQQLL